MADEGFSHEEGQATGIKRSALKLNIGLGGQLQPASSTTNSNMSKEPPGTLPLHPSLPLPGTWPGEGIISKQYPTQLVHHPYSGQSFNPVSGQSFNPASGQLCSPMSTGSSPSPSPTDSTSSRGSSAGSATGGRLGGQRKKPPAFLFKNTGGAQNPPTHTASGFVTPPHAHLPPPSNKNSQFLNPAMMGNSVISSSSSGDGRQPPPVPPRRQAHQSVGGGLRPQPHHWGYTAHAAHRERLRSHGLESSGKLKITADSTYDFSSEDLTDQGEIGRGAYGSVNKMYHEQSGTIMAVKRIRSTVEEKEQRQLLMDLDVVMNSKGCPFIVQFYGALFKEGDCWICMELMSISLDKFYKYTYHCLLEKIPENIIGKVTCATVKALSYLKDKLKIIHRDVKPSNILLDRAGHIKLCDFGISGNLVDSIAKTRDAGCRPYMAPERIDPRAASDGYDTRSDVWSLGITLMEVATGKFPYPKWTSVFDQLTQVVQGEPPRLKDDTFTPDFVNFVNTCLAHSYIDRPKYTQLLKHPFIKRSEREEVNVGGYVQSVLDKMPQDRLLANDSSNS